MFCATSDTEGESFRRKIAPPPPPPQSNILQIIPRQ